VSPLRNKFRIWLRDIVEWWGDGGSGSYVPVMVFRTTFRGCLYRYTTAVTTDNPLGWPAVVFNFNWLGYYLYAQLYMEYKEMLKEVLRCLQWLIDLQYSAVTDLPSLLATRAKDIYPRYYGKTLEEIADMFLDLARSAVTGGQATEPPPTDIYLWGATIAKAPGRKSKVERGLTEPVRASRLLRDWDYHRRVIPFTQFIVPLRNPAELQDLLRLGYLTVYPDYTARTLDKYAYPPRYNVIKAGAVVSQELLERLGLSYTDAFGLAVAVLAHLRRPLAETYRALNAVVAPQARLEATPQ
jgi:hypothetical protein